MKILALKVGKWSRKYDLLPTLAQGKVVKLNIPVFKSTDRLTTSVACNLVWKALVQEVTSSKNLQEFQKAKGMLRYDCIVS